MKNYVDSIEDFNKTVEMCVKNESKQLRIASLGRPSSSESPGIAKWVDLNVPENFSKIVDLIISNGHYLRTLPHGAPVFDYNGLSVCVADCLPQTNRVGNGMQPIFWSDGSLTYSWEWRGAVLM